MSVFWIVNPFDNLPEEGAKPQRYALLARALASRGHDVVWWTSAFSHSRKAPRVGADGRPLPLSWRNAEGIGMRLVPAPPYKGNAGLARVRNHAVFARNLARMAEDEVAAGRLAAPDAVIVSTPPLSTFHAAEAFRARWGTRVVLDIMDAWPDAFAALLPGPLPLKRAALRVLLAPLFRRAARAMRGADAISATSRQYLDLAAARGATAPMAAFPHTCETVADPAPHAPDAPLRLIYVGNMGRFYDLDTVLDAMALVRERGVAATLDLAGSGPAEERLRRRAARLDGVAFHGFLDAPRLAALLAEGDVGLIPLLPESAVAIPYKLPDYSSRGLAILECLGADCGGTVARHGAGRHYRAGDARGLAEAIAALAADREALAAMRRASSAMARAEFLADSVFSRFADWAESLV